MIALRLFPAALMLIVLAAHFLRSGELFLVVISLALILLLFLRRGWAAYAVQAGLVLGSLEWLRTAVLLVAERRLAEQPFLRLACILGVVALVTGLCPLLFRNNRIREHFRMGVRIP